ncbi:MAG: SDR family NAD(P)-dependent oxidoreductase [Terriglobales bacterium]
MTDSSVPLPLAGQTAFVTGASRRIGRAIALALARAGAAVAFTYRQSAQDALETERQLRQIGRPAIGIRMDLRHSQAIHAALEAAQAALGRLDIVVNNAGRYEDVPFEAISDAQWDAMMEANLRGPFLVSREAAPLLRANGGGRIINLGSVGASRAFPTHAHYCASKAGLEHLTRVMARALAPEIQVNAVAPGLIIFEPQLTAWEQKMAARSPMRRGGSPDDVAEAVCWFATCSRFITGQVLLVDGGLSLV